MTTGYTKIKNCLGKMIFRTAVCAVILTCTFSCMREVLPETAVTDGHIVFEVAGGIPATRADGRAEGGQTTEGGSIPLYLAGDTLCLTWTTEPNYNLLPDGKPGTRGVSITDESIETLGFYATALRDNGQMYFKDLHFSTPEDGVWRTDEYLWPAGNLSFCAYTTNSTEQIWQGSTIPAFSIKDGQCSGTFSYSLPKPEKEETEAPHDADKQPDIIFAMSPGRELADNPVRLLFHHALSAIVFKVGKIPENVRLESITLHGIHSSGNCKMTPDGQTTAGASGDNVKFVWTDLGEAKSYTQTLDGDKEVHEGDWYFKDNELSFMLIPQTLAEDTKFELKFDINGKKYTLLHTFKGIHSNKLGADVSEWKADTKYIYTIGLPEGIDVDVEDDVIGSVKENLSIKNTGMSPGYIRAAIVGYWTDNDGNITDPWIETDGESKKADGTFDWGSKWNEYWRKGSDGFYYYIDGDKMRLVPANTATAYPLFQTYTLSDAAKENHPDKTLELSIVAQIIIAKDFYDNEGQPCWPFPEQ